MDLKIKFPDQSNSFTYGVEYGRILQKIESGDSFVNNNGFPVRVENKDLLIQTCKEYNYTYNFGSEYFGEWIEFSALKITSSKN